MASLKDLTKQIGEMLRKTIDQCGDNWDLEIRFVQLYILHESRRHYHRLLAILLVLWLSRSQTPSSLKLAHSGAVTGDLQAKQRRVAGCPQGPSTQSLHVGDFGMMYSTL